MPGRELSAADAAKIHRFVSRRVANSADAADIAQQALLRAWAKRRHCRGESFSGWMFTIARHLIVDHYRAKGRFQFVELATVIEGEPALQTSPDSVRAVCERRERLSCLMGCITRQLRLEEQVAVLLADVYGHRDRDSARLLFMSLPSFKLLLHGARTRLREVAGGDCMLVRRTSSACGQNAERRKRDGPSPRARVGVTCHLDAPSLLALRAKLFDRLEC